MATSDTLSNMEKERRIVRIIEEANGEKPSQYIVRMLVDIEDEIQDLNDNFEKRFDMLETALNLKSDGGIDNWVKRNQTKAIAGGTAGFGTIVAGIFEAFRFLI